MQQQQQQQQQQQLKWSQHVDQELHESKGGRRSLISLVVSVDVKQHETVDVKQHETVDVKQHETIDVKQHETVDVKQHETVDVLSSVSQSIDYTFLNLISIPWEWSVYIMFCGTFPLSNKRYV